jgi:hypothetical protein
MINDFEPDRFFTNFFRTAKAVLLSPKPFYEGMKKEGGLWNPLIFLACCLVFHTLVVVILSKNPSLMAQNLSLGLVMPFVTAGILFFILTRLFKAPGTFEGAFRVNAYAGAVSLLSWVPLAGFLLEFYRVYLIIVGLSFAFSTKASRTFLAVVMTLVIYMLLGIAIFHLIGATPPETVP